MTPATEHQGAFSRIPIISLYTILAPRCDELYDYLARQGIGSQVIYPMLVPNQRAYRDQPLRYGPLPVARSLVGQILSLPMFPELRDDEIERIAAVRAFYQ